MENKAIEFTLKATRNNTFKVSQINAPEKAEEYIRQFYGDDILIYESFFIVLLDKSAKTLGFAKISQGGICGTVVDVRIVLKYAIDSLASSVIRSEERRVGKECR